MDYINVSKRFSPPAPLLLSIQSNSQSIEFSDKFYQNPVINLCWTGEKKSHKQDSQGNKVCRTGVAHVIIPTNRIQIPFLDKAR